VASALSGALKESSHRPMRIPACRQEKWESLQLKPESSDNADIGYQRLRQRALDLNLLFVEVSKDMWKGEKIRFPTNLNATRSGPKG
jgi:hypothetical protein